MLINDVEREIGPRADLRVANLSGARIGTHTVQSLVAGATRIADGYEFLLFRTEAGSVIRAGCRTFTPEEFRTHVATSYPDTPKASRTLAVLDYLEGELRASVGELT